MKGIKIGYCLCGSFCTFAQSIAQMETLAHLGADITPILSAAAFETDTRFGKAADIRARIEAVCGKAILHTIVGVEPIGPTAPFDIALIAPCTGNTLSKLAAGITDTSVTMAAKAHLRSGRPLCLALATNDALLGSSAALGKMLARKHIYFVPMRQDNPADKPTSLVADFTKIPAALEAALAGKQLQPLFQ